MWRGLAPAAIESDGAPSPRGAGGSLAPVLDGSGAVPDGCSGIGSAKTRCPAPSGLVLTASEVSPSSISLSWTIDTLPSGCEPSYSIWRKEGSGSYEEIVGSQTGTTHLDTGLSSGTTYTYRVRATNDGGTVLDEDEATTPGPSPPPEPPTGLTAREVSASAIQVSWNAVSGADRYEIQKQQEGGSWGVAVDVGSATSYRATGLRSNTSYLFQVRTIDGSETSGWTSPPASATTEPEVEPPTGLRANGISSSAIRVRWNAVQGADRYDIRWQRGSGSWGAPEDAGSGTSYRAGGLRSNTNYSFEVRTVDGSRTSDWSSSADATTWPRPTPPPEVRRPTGLTATAVSWSEVEVSWTAVSGADSYDIQRMESGGSWGDTVDAGAGTSYSYTGLTMNTEYSIRVRTVDGSRTSGWTASVSATTEVQPPGNPEANEESASSVRVTWDSIPGADRYDIRYREDGGSWGSPVNVGSATEYLVGSLTAATRHDFELRTVAGSRTSDWTASVSATTPSPDPDPPANFRSTGATATTVALGWDAVSGADHYRIRRAASGESGWESFTVETTSAVDEGLEPTTTYRYQIQTVPAEGRPSAPGGRPTSLPVRRGPPFTPLPASDPPDGPLLRPSPPPARGSGTLGGTSSSRPRPVQFVTRCAGEGSREDRETPVPDRARHGPCWRYWARYLVGATNISSIKTPADMSLHPDHLEPVRWSADAWPPGATLSVAVAEDGAWGFDEPADELFRDIEDVVRGGGTHPVAVERHRERRHPLEARPGRAPRGIARAYRHRVRCRRPFTGRSAVRFCQVTGSRMAIGGTSDHRVRGQAGPTWLLGHVLIRRHRGARARTLPGSGTIRPVLPTTTGRRVGFGWRGRSQNRSGDGAGCSRVAHSARC